jgi:hypothetical protein
LYQSVQLKISPPIFVISVPANKCLCHFLVIIRSIVNNHLSRVVSFHSNYYSLFLYFIYY